MHTAIVHLKSSPGSPLSQGRHHSTPSLNQESHEAYDERTWRQRMHVTESGYVYIPPSFFKNGLTEAAGFLKMRIPGQGTATYKKRFESGIIVVEPLILPVLADDVQGIKRFVPANGQRGGNKRVWRRFPEIPSWEGSIEIAIIDEMIEEHILRQHLDVFGKFIGIGVYRPARNGHFGRFSVTEMVWE